jgi:3-oxoacyl-[acyl-carrier protein] reductase
MAAGDDAWIVVSGAAGALGGALASHYASRGRPVLGLDRNFDGATAVAGLTARAADILVEDEVRQALADAIPASARIALLVNAVGLIWNEPVLALRGARFATHSLESWRRVTDANLTAPFIMATHVAARMVRRGGGSIVNFSSIASQGNAGQAAYSAAKAGIEGLTRTMAIELGPLGVRVNAVALGYVDAATTRIAVAEERLAGYVHATPLGRLGRVDDVIGAVEFLATNTFANGAIVRLDGGLRL